MKHILLIVLLGASLSVTAQTKLSLSYDDALQMLQKGNQSLKIADKGIEAARTERDKLNALWYPSLQGAGTYVHMSEKIEVKQPLSQFTDPAKDFVHGIIPDDKFISGILDQIGSYTLGFPSCSPQSDYCGLNCRMGGLFRWKAYTGRQNRKSVD